MKIQRAIALGALFAAAAGAQTLPCNEAASQRKLTGASKQSFLKTCEVAARAACANQAKELSQTAAGKANFQKQCLRDAMGD